MITVLGSVNVDLVLQLPRLPDVGETVLTPTFTQAVGGKGANQAIAAARAGAPVRFVGAVGADAFGATARKALVDAGVDVTRLATVDGATGIAMVWVDSEGRNMIAVASGANATVNAGMPATAELGAGDLLVLQMEIPPATVAAAIETVTARGARVVLNLAPALPLPAETLRRVAVLVVNEHEAATLAATLGLATAEPKMLTSRLAAHLATTVIVTLGAEGAIAASEGSLWHASALPVTSIDTTGAGDCFVGVLAAGLTEGRTLAEAMRRAAVAGSLACTVIGAEPSFPGRARIEAATAVVPPPVRIA